MNCGTQKNFRLAVASGKGGTGKTTLAVNLALTAAESAVLLDCDVEEPNCHIFLNPRKTAERVVGIPVPEVDEAKCDGCGECSKFCRFNALAVLGGRVLVFPELCHGCGGCAKICPKGAISEREHRVGVVETGESDGITLVQGRLDVGHPMAPPLIRAVVRGAPATGITIIDCPPGTSCPVVAALRGCDYAILATESTPFGLNDLELAVATVRQLGKPFGVVVNRSDGRDTRVADYCRAEGIPLLLEIPENRRVAEAYSRGETIVAALPELRAKFNELWSKLPVPSPLGHAAATPPNDPSDLTDREIAVPGGQACHR